MPFSEHREAPARLYCFFTDLELETLFLIERCYSRSKVSRQNPTEPQMDSKDVANYNLRFNLPTKESFERNSFYLGL